MNILFLLPTQLAVCPICTVTIGAGLAMSNWLGIDDLVTSIWIGGILASATMWTIDWLDRKQKTFRFYKEITWLSFCVLTFVSLYFSNLIFIDDNDLWGIDKIILGIIVGGVVFVGSSMFYQYLKKNNNDKAHFPFEKVVIPVVALAITSFIGYLLVK